MTTRQSQQVPFTASKTYSDCSRSLPQPPLLLSTTSHNQDLDFYAHNTNSSLCLRKLTSSSHLHILDRICQLLQVFDCLEGHPAILVDHNYSHLPKQSPTSFPRHLKLNCRHGIYKLSQRLLLHAWPCQHCLRSRDQVSISQARPRSSPRQEQWLQGPSGTLHPCTRSLRSPELRASATVRPQTSSTQRNEELCSSYHGTTEPDIKQESPKSWHAIRTLHFSTRCATKVSDKHSTRLYQEAKGRYLIRRTRYEEDMQRAKGKATDRKEVTRGK